MRAYWDDEGGCLVVEAGMLEYGGPYYEGGWTEFQLEDNLFWPVSLAYVDMEKSDLGKTVVELTPYSESPESGGTPQLPRDGSRSWVDFLYDKFGLFVTLNSVEVGITPSGAGMYYELLAGPYGFFSKTDYLIQDGGLENSNSEVVIRAKYIPKDYLEAVQGEGAGNLFVFAEDCRCLSGAVLIPCWIAEDFYKLSIVKMNETLISQCESIASGRGWALSGDYRSYLNSGIGELFFTGEDKSLFFKLSDAGIIYTDGDFVSADADLITTTFALGGLRAQPEDKDWIETGWSSFVMFVGYDEGYDEYYYFAFGDSFSFSAEEIRKYVMLGSRRMDIEDMDERLCYGRTTVQGNFRLNDVNYIKLYYSGGVGSGSSAPKKFWQNLKNCIEY